MDTPDNQEEMPTLEAAEGSRSNYESLAQFVISILILVIVISGTLNILLLRLWKNSKSDVEMLRPQYQNFVAMYQRNDAPAIEKITKTLSAYGATNPDYVPILAKYGFKPTPAPSLSAPPAASAPPKK